MIIDTKTAGTVSLSGDEKLKSWKIKASTSTPARDVELLKLKFYAEKETPPPQVKIEFSLKKLDMFFQWTPEANWRSDLPFFGGARPLSRAFSHYSPFMVVYNQKGGNRFALAVSEALRKIVIDYGVKTYAGYCLSFAITLFSEAEAPLKEYEVELRFDRRRAAYSEIASDIVKWYESFPLYKPSVSPEIAFEPFYSSWYCYRQEVEAKSLEAECALASSYGMKGVIVDDGWQTDRNDGYRSCGAWIPAKSKFPDMRGHVERVHALGMKYLLWIGLPFIGCDSPLFQRFQGKYLFCRWGNTYVLDPRFREVREFLASRFEEMLRDWDIDGFKFDYIECFRIEDVDPAIAEDYAGRDMKSVPLAADRLLEDIMRRLRAIKPDVLIEFRQSYVGPAPRKYGNIFRVGDCPCDIFSNRAHSIDLRLSSGATAVHSDMLIWDSPETSENAAAQLLASLFATLQISVRLAEIPEGHKRVLRFWLDFMKTHKDTLQKSPLQAKHPEANYPLVRANGKSEEIVASYCADCLVELEGLPGRTYYVVNASGEEELPLELGATPKSVARLSAEGVEIAGAKPEKGARRIDVPVSGMLVLKY